MSESKSSGGIGIFGVVFVVLITLKLAGVEPVASWSWWWVTVPLWGGFILATALYTLGMSIAAMDDWSRRRAKMKEFEE